MIVSREQARAIIARAYPGMSFRITRSCTLGVRPVAQVTADLPCLAWQAVSADRVRLGRLAPPCSIDWSYAP